MIQVPDEQHSLVFSLLPAVAHLDVSQTVANQIAFFSSQSVITKDAGLLVVRVDESGD
jgi:hypothetical protein